MPRKKKEPPQTACFWGRGIDFTGSDGVIRKVVLQRGPNGYVRLAWETWWEGIEKEPFTTEVKLSLPALNATMALLAELQAFPEHFQSPAPQA